MRVLVLLAVCAAAPSAAAQTIIDCALLNRRATPPDLHQNATYAAQVTDGRVRLIARRAAGYFTQAVDLQSNPSRPGFSMAFALAPGHEAEAEFASAELRGDGTIMFEEWSISGTGSRRTRTSLSITLRCGPAP